MSGPVLRSLTVADPPDRWRALGFEIPGDELMLDGVRVSLGGEGEGITAWSIADLPNGAAWGGLIDGLRTTSASSVPASSSASIPPHPNGATAVDHVVLASPDFDRTAGALGRAGMPLRRVRDTGSSRQGFRRIGPAVLELVEATQMAAGPARFWGLVVTVTDLDALRDRLDSELLSEPKAAVQPGRRIATVRRSAGSSTALAFMSPEPRR